MLFQSIVNQFGRVLISFLATYVFALFFYILEVVEVTLPYIRNNVAMSNTHSQQRDLPRTRSAYKTLKSMRNYQQRGSHKLPVDAASAVNVLLIRTIPSLRLIKSNHTTSHDNSAFKSEEQLIHHVAVRRQRDNTKFYHSARCRFILHGRRLHRRHHHRDHSLEVAAQRQPPKIPGSSSETTQLRGLSGCHPTPQSLTPRQQNWCIQHQRRKIAPGTNEDPKQIGAHDTTEEAK